MTVHRAFLSLLQYSPDPLRAEAVNVGVVLLDPKSGRLGFRGATDLKRARRAFHWAETDSWWLKRSIAGVEASLAQQHELAAVVDEASLRAFGEGLGGEIRLTAPRPVPVREFDASLQQAFDRLVEAPAAALEGSEPASTLSVAQPLRDAFLSLRTSLKSVGIDRSFQIEGLNFTIRTDFDYRNGTANLVRLLKVGKQRQRSAVKTAIDLGGESIQVSKHLLIDGLKAKLIVVVTPVAPSDTVTRIETEIERLAGDYPEAEYVTSQKIPALAERILAEAK